MSAINVLCIATDAILYVGLDSRSNVNDASDFSKLGDVLLPHKLSQSCLMNPEMFVILINVEHNKRWRR
uniref:Uncharacterized protein n=1 Tax=Rhizophora mucronata TaxID=61149 RepID=A0A2P2QCL0_RHIMU